jgi:hypothetical protein
MLNQSLSRWGYPQKVHPVKPDLMGKGRHAWVYNTRSDLMMVLLFPSGYVPDDCKPYPERAKEFKGRIVAYWKFEKDGAEIRWSMRKTQTNLAQEVIRINQKAIRKPNRAIGAVVIDPPIEDTRGHHAETTAARGGITEKGTTVVPKTQGSSIEPQLNIGSLAALLDKAVALVPRMGLAWGIVGIAAAAAIVNVILGLNRLAFVSGFLVFSGMVVLFAFTQIPARDRVTRIAGQLLVATIALATVIFIGSSLWAAMFCAPPGFVYLYSLGDVCGTQRGVSATNPDGSTVNFWKRNLVQTTSTRI